MGAGNFEEFLEASSQYFSKQGDFHNNLLCSLVLQSRLEMEDLESLNKLADSAITILNSRKGAITAHIREYATS